MAHVTGWQGIVGFIAARNQSVYTLIIYAVAEILKLSLNSFSRSNASIRGILDLSLKL